MSNSRENRSLAFGFAQEVTELTETGLNVPRPRSTKFRSRPIREFRVFRGRPLRFRDIPCGSVVTTWFPYWPKTHDYIRAGESIAAVCGLWHFFCDATAAFTFVEH